MNADVDCFVFWKDTMGKIFKITYKDEDLLSLRPEIDKQILIEYVQAYHRSLTAESLINNLRSLKKSTLNGLFRGCGTAKVFSTQGTENCNAKDGATSLSNVSFKKIAYDYTGFNEKMGFSKPAACRYLAYKVLAKSLPNNILPVDIHEVNDFFDTHFKGEPEEVFHRFCEIKNIEKDETLRYYKNKCNLDEIYNVKRPTKDLKKPNAGETLLSAWLHITK